MTLSADSCISGSHRWRTVQTKKNDSFHLYAVSRTAVPCHPRKNIKILCTVCFFASDTHINTPNMPKHSFCLQLAIWLICFFFANAKVAYYRQICITAGALDRWYDVVGPHLIVMEVDTWLNKTLLMPTMTRNNLFKNYVIALAQNWRILSALPHARRCHGRKKDSVSKRRK